MSPHRTPSKVKGSTWAKPQAPFNHRESKAGTAKKQSKRGLQATPTEAPAPAPPPVPKAHKAPETRHTHEKEPVLFCPGNGAASLPSRPDPVVLLHKLRGVAADLDDGEFSQNVLFLLDDHENQHDTGDTLSMLLEVLVDHIAPFAQALQSREADDTRHRFMLFYSLHLFAKSLLLVTEEAVHVGWNQDNPAVIAPKAEPPTPAEPRTPAQAVAEHKPTTRPTFAQQLVHHLGQMESAEPNPGLVAALASTLRMLATDANTLFIAMKSDDVTLNEDDVTRAIWNIEQRAMAGVLLAESKGR